MEHKVIVTSDGSRTIHLPELNESYHSTHGALQEAEHVFIAHGLAALSFNSMKVFELGFGTGLNAILAYRYAVQQNVAIEYTGIEAFPVDQKLISELEYTDFLDEREKDIFLQMHATPWNEKAALSDFFSFTKVHAGIEEYSLMPESFDVIFFDAFGPRAQGELWTVEILQKMYEGLKREGLLTTYCAQGQFKRNLRTIGFHVEAQPGPPGKREMTNAWKYAEQVDE